ncbi:MAG: RseA family anti-sigma factor [Granulosicoccus sp.]
MQHSDHQTLSQLMDGEWQDIDSSDCIAGICRDASLQSKWGRYHLIRDVIKNESVDPQSILAARISAALENEPVYSNVSVIGVPDDADITRALPVVPDMQDQTRQSGSLTKARAADLQTQPVNNWRTGVAGFALAASVALATVGGLSLWNAGGIPGSADDAAQVASSTAEGATAVGAGAFSSQVPGAPLPEVDYVANTGSFWVSPETTRRSASEQRLNMFLSQHIENSPTADRQGMLPYSRLVGYQERGPE